MFGLSTELKILKRKIGHRKDIRALTFRVLSLRQSESDKLNKYRYVTQIFTMAATNNPGGRAKKNTRGILKKQQQQKKKA